MHFKDGICDQCGSEELRRCGACGNFTDCMFCACFLCEPHQSKQICTLCQIPFEFCSCETDEELPAPPPKLVYTQKRNPETLEAEAPIKKKKRKGDCEHRLVGYLVSDKAYCLRCGPKIKSDHQKVLLYKGENERGLYVPSDHCLSKKCSSELKKNKKCRTCKKPID